MSRTWWVVYWKELRENARDRRVLLSALLYGPLVGPVLFAVMMAVILGRQQAESQQTLELPVIGAEQAPVLMEYLRQQGVRILSPPADPAEAVRRMEHPVVLAIAPEFGAAWRAGEPAPLDLYLDRSQTRGRVSVDRVQALLQAYASRTGAQRLQLRGVHPELSRPLAMRIRDQSTDQSRAAMILMMLPYLLILSAFIGGMYLAIDTTAGERERGSLEALLLCPAGRGEVLFGKFLATSSYAGASALISVLAFGASTHLIPADTSAMELKLPISVIAQLLLVMAPVPLVAAAAQMLVAAFAHSFREAQTYLQMLMLVPMVPTLLIALNPVNPQGWMWATPLFSQSLLINQLARGEAMSATTLLLATGSTLLVSAALLLVGRQLAYRERFVLAG